MSLCFMKSVAVIVLLWKELFQRDAASQQKKRFVERLFEMEITVE